MAVLQLVIGTQMLTETIASPLITIGIAVYNGAKFIYAALESALQQSHSNLEIIIYDDASTDDTLNIIEHFQDPRIHLIEGKENQGVAYARQTIKLQAKGHYLIWLDSDDLFHPFRVERLLQAAQKNNSDITIDLYSYIDEEGAECGKAKSIAHYLKSDPCFTRLFERNQMPAHPLISQRCYRNIDFDIQLHTSEDYDYWLKCSIAGYHFYQVQQYLMYYRITSCSLSSSIKHSRLATEKILEKYPLSSIRAIYETRGLSQHVNKMAYLRAIYTKHYTQAATHIKTPWEDEENCDFNFYKGTSELYLGKLTSARHYLEKHLLNHPLSFAGLNNLGVTLKKLGLPHRYLWQKALVEFPRYQDAEHNLQNKETITFTQLQAKRLR